MRRSERGSASVWMVSVVLVVLSSAFGVAAVGRSSGDYIRRQISADAASRSSGAVLAERLCHIGRIQQRGMAAAGRRTQSGCAEASRLAGLAWKIANNTVGTLKKEGADRARDNGATSWKCGVDSPQLFVSVPVQTGYYYRVRRNGKSRRRWRPVTIWFVALAPEFSSNRIRVALKQPDADKVARPAHSMSWVTGTPSSPLTSTDWSARLSAVPGE